MLGFLLLCCGVLGVFYLFCVGIIAIIESLQNSNTKKEVALKKAYKIRGIDSNHFDVSNRRSEDKIPKNFKLNRDRHVNQPRVDAE